jgi:hypothetical protein
MFCKIFFNFRNINTYFFIHFLGASLGHYEADVEESGPDMNHGKDGSWSDSESGFLHPPIKSKLKGLLGKKFIYGYMVHAFEVGQKGNFNDFHFLR